MVEEVESESALHENITRKGSNSYYYAHGNTAKGPAWDGREEPRLLSTSAVPPVSSVKAMMSSFESFSWLDDNKYVKVYIEYDGANDILDEDISLATTADSLEFTVLGVKNQCLNLSPLFEKIESATYQKKTDKFVLKLKKATVSSWDKLKKSS